MNRMMTRLALATALIASPALAGEDCAVPMTDWQPREAVVKLAAEQGWDLRRIRIDDGCYEVTGRDASGRMIEAKLDPATLAVVEMEFEDDHDEDHEDGKDD
ncbi:MAG: PepSY domain-containing protein [Pseudorhodobacter sp.]|nr:MAG: PepSY domain-containing protein [Pseudorhodobacter sp.]